VDLDLQTALRRLRRAGRSPITPEAISELPPNRLPFMLDAVLRALTQDQLDKVYLQIAQEELRRCHEAECSVCTHRRDMHESGSPYRCYTASCDCSGAWPDSCSRFVG
jgi:hypothetical protein